MDGSKPRWGIHDRNKTNITPLIDAAREERRPSLVVLLLEKKGAGIHATSAYVRFALHRPFHAIKRGLTSLICYTVDISFALCVVISHSYQGFSSLHLRLFQARRSSGSSPFADGFIFSLQCTCRLGSYHRVVCWLWIQRVAALLETAQNVNGVF